MYPWRILNFILLNILNFTPSKEQFNYLMEDVFKPLAEQLKEIKNEIKLPIEEEDILKDLKPQKPNEQLLNEMRKAVKADENCEGGAEGTGRGTQRTQRAQRPRTL